ncbi:MAG: carboxylating nicotinate-nucleotide diphosphorylase [Actinomycetota bacterium]
MLSIHPLSADTAARLTAASLDPHAIASLIETALVEDLADGVDVTSAATIPEGQRCVVTFGARDAGVVAGLPVAVGVIDMVCGDDTTVEYLATDGDRVERGMPVARVAAPTRAMLTAERTALNLLCHLSGIATLTRRWADQLDDTSAKVRDTRKTLPGLRALQKYAVRCGGGSNHRMGLFDMALVKDNHVAAAGGIAEAYAAVIDLEDTMPVEIEVDDLASLRIAIEAGADEVLIDNFSTDDMRAAVAVRDEMNPAVLLEASGGLTLESAAAVAATGVDYIAVGELTHSVRVLDLGLDWETIDD